MSEPELRRRAARIASALVLAAILIGSFQPFYLRIFTVDAQAMRAMLTELPYRKLAGFRRFLLEVDRTTPRGARIAICLPFTAWEGGYGYGYYRASFLLPGKQVVPLLRLDADVPAPGNVALADFVACWHGAPRIDGFEVLWRSGDGVLLEEGAVIAAVVTSLLLVLVGWPVAAVLDRRPAPLDRRLAESYLLGAALASLVLFVHHGWSRASLLIPLFVISAACAWFGRGGLGVTRCGVHWIDLATAVLVAGYARFATIGPTAEYDFIGIWGLKAKEFWLAGGIDWKFLENPFNQFAHVDYPLLVPLVFDAHAVVAGGWPDRWLGVVNVAFGLAALLLLRAFLAEQVRKPLLLALATLACVGVAFAPWIGLAEGALVAYGTAGLLFVRKGEVSRGALYLGLAAMCKNEGLTLIVAAAVAMAVAGSARKIVRLWPAAAVVVPWLIIRSIHHLQTDLTTSGVGERVVEHLGNLRPMFEAMLRYPVGRPLLWLAIAAAIVIGAREVGRRERFLAAAIALQLLFFVAAYVITPHDVEWHVRWSWERIVDQLAAPATFLALVLVLRRLHAPPEVSVK